MSTVARTILWYEGQADLVKIMQPSLKFHLAKSVAMSPDSPPISNVIWKSLNVAPRVAIVWSASYALNWSIDLPQDGGQIILTTSWQPCSLGEAYDIGRDGIWAKSTLPGTAGWMTVGKVDFQVPGDRGIHIILGVLNSYTNDYEPVFIDPFALKTPGLGKKYQPQEEVKWWLDQGGRASTVYSETAGAVGSANFNDPSPITNEYKAWTTFLFDSNTWVTSPTVPTASKAKSPAVFTSKDAKENEPNHCNGSTTV